MSKFDDQFDAFPKVIDDDQFYDQLIKGQTHVTIT
jgi:hypothetical protein